MDNQKKAFIEFESDNYFSRNQAILTTYNPDNDSVIKILKDYNYQPKSVLEIGCNAGYRLDGIKKNFPNCEVFGLEPSKEAIRYGSGHYKDITFIEGTIDDLSSFENGKFDLVIIGFVLYVVDRSLLFKAVSEIDRVIGNNGVLINIDFFATTPHKNAYNHIPGNEAFSYKQNYEEIFLASRLYQQIDKRSFNHTDKKYDITDNFYDKYSICSLKKNTIHGYSTNRQ